MRIYSLKIFFVFCFFILSPVLVDAKVLIGDKRSITPLMELQGSTCFGYFQLTTHYLDFYTPFLDCHRMKYSGLEHSENPVEINGNTYSSIWMTLDRPTKRCPFAVVEVLNEGQDDSATRHVIGYSSKESFESRSWGINKSNGTNDMPADSLLCTAYPTDSKQMLQIRPESKRAKPQVRQK